MKLNDNNYHLLRLVYTVLSHFSLPPGQVLDWYIKRII